MKRARITLNFIFQYLICRIRIKNSSIKNFLESCETGVKKDLIHTDRTHIEDWRTLYNDQRLRRIVRANCLNASLAIYRMMVRAGLNPILHLGVRRVGDELEGHCWLTANNEFLSDKDKIMATKYQEMLVYQGAGK